MIYIVGSVGKNTSNSNIFLTGTIAAFKLICS